MVHVARSVAMLALLAAGFFWLAPRETRPAVPDVRFEERAEQAGCLNRHSMVRLADEFENIMPWLSSVGAAAAAGDYDDDGYADLYVTNSGRGDSNRLFHNRGDGTFEDVTSRAGVGCGDPEGASMHAVWGDVDNDGDLDLFVGKWAAPNSLFRNNGDGTFADVSREAGVDFWGYANGATFVDHDRDGRLDLLVGNYFAERVVDPKSGELVRNDLWHPVTTRVMHETFTHADNGGRNVFYRNVSEGGAIRFQDVTESLGLTFTGWTLAVGSGDLNNDGWPDLYAANDFGPDELYLNTGAVENPPRFRLVVDPRGHPGVGNDWWKGMNVDMGDVNNDGYLDIYVTNILERRYKTDEGNMLWLNCVDPLCPGGRGFKNIAEESGTNDGGWGWGGKFADFNNDGLLDIYTVNGFVTGGPERNYWFAIQEMVTQTKNQTADARDWPVMGDRDLSGHERGRLFMQQAGWPTALAVGESKTLPGTTGEATKRRSDTGSAPRQYGAVEQSRDREGAGSSDAGTEARRHAGTKEPGVLPEPSGREVPIVHRQSTTASPRFVEMAEAAGIADTYNGRGIALADFDHDGWIDMYVANQGAPSCYYVNRTSGGMAKRSAAMPDADASIAAPVRGHETTNGEATKRRSDEGTEAQRHAGTEGGEDQGTEAGWPTASAVGESKTLPGTTGEATTRRSDGATLDTARQGQAPQRSDAGSVPRRYGAAEQSRDREGAGNSDEGTAARRHEGGQGFAPEPGFLWLKLIGRPDLPNRVGGRLLASSRDAVGARVTLWTEGGARQVREVQGGMGFASQSEHAVHFGVPDPAAVERVTIDWPSGRRQKFSGEAVRQMVGRHVTIREEDGNLAAR